MKRQFILGFMTLVLSASAVAQTHFTFTANTGNNATVAIPTSANPNIGSLPLANGDEIGTFTPGGLCVGAVVWAGANTAITVWGDNDQTPAVDGIAAGQTMSFRIWRQSTNTEFPADASVNETPPFQSTLNYSANGLYQLASLGVPAGLASKYVVTASSASVTAGGTVTVQAQLADANGLPVVTAGKTVAWSKTGTGGSFASPTSTTDASGIATVVFTTHTVAGTVHTVTGTDGNNFTGTSGNITTIAGTATQYVVTATSYSPVAGAYVTISAQLADANNNPVATAGKTVTWSKTGTGGSFASPTSTTDAAGLATVNFTTHTVAGTIHTVTGTDGDNLTGTTGNIITVAGTATKYIVTSSSSGPVAGVPVTITAQLADANDNPVATSGKTVTWSKTGTGGSFANPTSSTNASGIAAVAFTTHTVAGTVHTITGTDGDNLTGMTGNITTVVGVAAKYVLTSSSSSPVAGANVTINAQLADANNNSVATAGKTVTWSKSGTGGSFASSSSTTDASGIASVVLTTHTLAGTIHTVSGTDGDNLSGTSANITTVSGTATKYVVSSSNNSPVAGTTVTITAQLSDANNNPVATAGKTVTWGSTNGGTFSSPTGVTSGGGAATVTFTTSSTIGTDHVVTATDGDNIAGSGATITTAAGPPTKYVVTSSNNSPAAGTVVTITAQLADAGNNPIKTAGRVVTWSKTGTGGSFASPATTTDANGVATVSFTTHTLAGTVHTATATDANSLTGTSGNITTVAGPAAKYVLTSSNNGPVAGSDVTVTAQLADAHNNPVATTGKTVTWSKTGTGGSFATPTSTTNASGAATVVFTTNTVSGTVHTVTASDGDSFTGTSGNITTVAGAAANYHVTSSIVNPVAGSTVLITAQLADANFNPVSTAGKVVTWGKTGQGGSLSNPTSVTNASGIATVNFTTHTVAGTIHTVTAADGDNITGLTGSIVTISGTATKYVVLLGRTNPAAGDTVLATAQLADANNNPVATSGKTVTWGKTGTGGSFANPTSTTNASGAAMVVFTTHTLAGTIHTITGTDEDNFTGTSADLTTIPGAATKYVVTSSATSAIAGTSVTMTAQLADVNNNSVPIAGKTVTWSSSNGGTFASPTSITGANGSVTVVFTTSNIIGTVHTVTATDGDNLTGTSPAINTTAGPPTKYIVTISRTNPVVGDTVKITAQLADVGNNPNKTAGRNVLWSKTGNGGSFSQGSTLTDANGIATVIFTVHTIAGTVHQVSATDQGALTGTGPQITTVAGVAAKYRVTASRYDPAAGDTITIFAQLSDAHLNSVVGGGKTVTWSATGGGTFAAPTSTTSTTGLAMVVFTVSTSPGTLHVVTATDNDNFIGTSGNIIPPIAAPTLTYPPNAAVNIPTTVTFTWGGVGGASTYQLEVSLDHDFATHVINQSGLGAISFVANLSPGKVYNWRVTAQGASGNVTSEVFSFTTATSGPTAPTLTTPPNNAVGVDSSPTLKWDPIVGAIGYRVQLSADSAFATVLLDDSLLTVAEKVVGPLTHGAKYYWRVATRGSSGAGQFSAPFSFTVIIVAPALLLPLDGDPGVPATLTVSWIAVPQATTYHLQMATDSSMAGLVVNDSTIAGTEKEIGPLQSGRKYYWRVTAKTATVKSAFSPTRSFTVAVTVPPPDPLEPPDGASGVPTSPSITWSTPQGSITLRIATGLSSNTTYFWRVRLLFPSGASTFSSVFRFTTGGGGSTLSLQRIASVRKAVFTVASDTVTYQLQISTAESFDSIIVEQKGITPLAAPQLESPADSALSFSLATSFSWGSVDGATSYRLQLSFSPTFDTMERDSIVGTATSATLSGFAPATTYYWKVTAIGSGGLSSTSLVWSFRTSAGAPGTPALLGPVDNAQGVSLTPVLQWNHVVTATVYHVQVSLAETFQTVAMEDSTVIDTSKAIGPLSLNTTYYWRVRAKNQGGKGPFSETRQFRTIPTTAIEAVGDLIPEELSLSQNYPNPFNPATMIRFDIPSTSTVTLRIYNTLGQVVAFLIDNELPPGRYQVEWRPTGMASGVYYYRLEAISSGIDAMEPFVKTRKLILSK